MYYFQVVAFNKYGNTSSNCLEIKVLFPPSEFQLNNITQIPNTDGNVNLSWSDSIGARNYSIYFDDTYISNITIQGSLVAGGIDDTFYLIENLINGDYYYIVVAINEAGETLSNCIHILVRRAPTSFKLTSNASKPDDDGNFELIWTHSEFAQEYVIYFINHSSSNNSIKILYNFIPSFQWPTYRYGISGWNNGTYSFKISAFNEYGNFQTDWLEIKVSIPPDNGKQNNGSNFPVEFIQQVIIYLIFAGALGGLVFLYIRRKKSFI